MSASALAITPGSRLGGFEIERPIGTGGLASVYLGWSRKGSPAALKVIRPHDGVSIADRRGRLGHEAMVLDAIRGPHVPHVLEIGMTCDTPWLAMTVAGEQSLADLVRERGACCLGQAREVMLGVGRALQGIHDAGVWHMDITPSNVMLSGNRVRIVDFGAALSSTGSPLAGPGMYDGTAGYVAPERCLGVQPDRSMDVFSLGAVAYRILLGARPYVDSRTLEFGQCISPKRLRAPHLLRHDISPALGDLLMRTLSLDPTRRPASAADFTDELAALLPGR